MKTGVLLFNLGGPETPADVRPFLFNLFSDPEIIRIQSDALRRSLAWLIARVRQNKSKELYRQIGGGSPLRKITESQAAALGAELASRGHEARVYVGMRCWKPSIDEAVDRILRDGIRRLILLPLFPHYSSTTTGSCFRHFQTLDRQASLSSNIQISYVQSWFAEPLYVEAMADLIREGLTQFPQGDRENVHILYSAHSIPARYVREGDPFLEQSRQSVALIDAQLANAHASTLSFQSRIGPVKWLGPSTREVLKKLSKDGVAGVLAVPISFVSDHLETLQEIDVQYKQLAADLGIRRFYRAAALNVYPKFIQALAVITLNALQKNGNCSAICKTGAGENR
jgi:protoporphyrin/coproporphyrin ferrochelatase